MADEFEVARMTVTRSLLDVLYSVFEFTSRVLGFHQWMWPPAILLCGSAVGWTAIFSGIARLQSLMKIWGAIEAAGLVWFYCWLMPNRLQPRTVPDPAHHPPKALLEKFLESLDDLCRHEGDSYIDNFIRGWFGDDAARECLRRTDVRSFFAWAAFSCDPADLGRTDAALLEGAVGDFGARHSIELRDDADPRAKACPPKRLTLEPMQCMWRPLFTYATIALLRGITQIILTAAGFVAHLDEPSGYKIWVRSRASVDRLEGTGFPEHEPASHGKLPVVFFHGVSFGILPYLRLLRRICSKRPCAIPEAPFISMTLRFATDSGVGIGGAIERLLDAQGWDRVILGGHSFGSVHAWWVRRALGPSRVAGVALLDPIGPLLFDSKVCHRFVYQTPRKLLEWIVYYSARSEVGIAHFMRRHFWWYNIVIFPDEMPGVETLIGLSTRDEIVPAVPMHRMLARVRDKARERAPGAAESPPLGGERSMARLALFQWDQAHGGLLINGPALTQVARWMVGIDKAHFAGNGGNGHTGDGGR